MKTVLVHSSSFHADDVFAVATLMLAIREDWYVVRSQDPKDIAEADVVFDVGGEYDVTRRRFDHHQTGGAGVRENGIPYASFGLAWKTYGSTAVAAYGVELAPEALVEVAKAVDARFVAALDANDCGVDLVASTHSSEVIPSTLSSLVASYNLTWRELEEAGDNADSIRRDRFLQLVEMAKGALDRVIRREIDRRLGEDDVREALDHAADRRVIVLNAERPWFDVLESVEEALYCVYPDSRGGWAAKAVRAKKGSMESKLPFPESWRGKRDAELVTASGVADARFCHNSGFLASANTKEGALALVAASLAAAGRPNLILTV